MGELYVDQRGETSQHPGGMSGICSELTTPAKVVANWTPGPLSHCSELPSLVGDSEDTRQTNTYWISLPQTLMLVRGPDLQKHGTLDGRVYAAVLRTNFRRVAGYDVRDFSLCGRQGDVSRRQ